MYSFEDGYKPKDRYPVGAVLWGMILALCLFLLFLFVAYPDLLIAGVS